MNIVESHLDYDADGKAFRGVICEDNQVLHPRAVVVLLPDWRGQSDLAKNHARRLVALNCAVVIADLYGGGFTTDDHAQVGGLVKKLIENRDHGVAATAACVDAVRILRPDVPIVCLGYSAGGMIVLDYGRSGADVAGIITCSGLLKTAVAGMPTKIGAPVLMLQGTQDVVSSMDVINALVGEMDAAGNNFRIQLFGQTHHAFDNPEVGIDPTARLVYSATSDAWSRNAIAAFIEEVVRPKS